MNFFDRFVSYLTPGHTEGVVLYLLSVIIMTLLQLYFKREWTDGLKGTNGYWEGPEILLYIALWLWPPMLFADIFLQLKASDLVWYMWGAALFFGLTGRFGLEWILAFRSGANQVTTIETKKEVTKEQTTTTKENE